MGEGKRKKDKDGKGGKGKDGKGKKGKQPIGGCWTCLAVLGILGGLSLMACLAVPLRIGRPLFPLMEFKTFQAIYTKAKTPKPWMQVVQQTCQRSAQFGLVGGALGAACGAMSPASALTADCDLSFQRHMRSRCTQYSYIMGISYAYGGFCIMAGLGALGVAIWVFLGGIKSKGIIAAVWACIGLLAIVATVGYIFAGNHALKPIRDTAEYPYPSPYIGVFLAHGAGALVLIAGCFGGADAHKEAKIAREERKKKMEEEAALLMANAPGAAGAGDPAAAGLPGAPGGMGPPGGGPGEAAKAGGGKGKK
uniref:Claudin n=1 Tax=Chromera velia CCMP2878 TaxID=1169474 RepID=A0A0G4I3Y3_9ALVE|eukprot:Cvel_1778.t1-p1 / transcript=Cvel_1778.t1 / gene=Cvel_1778 / organism=Chromera_velia_CCMP2878 / gene_product=hypothetical protein / transcript_product=hypothetical protein / location=Cvel_scaffold65:67314-70452(+) / protein_length=307 / sequence_SO=supercontig / SO=protein_coding / is_pseudo=false